MNNVLLLNKIAKCGTDNLDAAKYNIGSDIENPDAIMVRSANMLEMDFNKNLSKFCDIPCKNPMDC